MALEWMDSAPRTPVPPSHIVDDNGVGGCANHNQQKQSGSVRGAGRMRMLRAQLQALEWSYVACVGRSFDAGCVCVQYLEVRYKLPGMKVWSTI